MSYNVDASKIDLSWFVGWLGGAVYVAHQPGYGFWDGVVWLYYVGRYVAQHFTVLS